MPIVVGKSDECAVITLGSYVLLLWRKRIVSDGVRWLREAFEAQLKDYPDEKIGFLTVIEAGCELTTPADVRHDLAELLRRHQKDLAAAAIVFEEQGFRATMVRSVITAIYLATRVRFPNSVFADVQGAAQFLEQHHGYGASATNVSRTVATMRKAVAR